ncbi:hypothetical protein M0805_003009 [Coniferiporia weirii]|nr:hypothetical protein M0805_003009 [Coniferiporia weirii]
MTTFLITLLGKEDIILGLPWLKCHNPTIDWTTGTMSISKVTMAMTLAQDNVKPVKSLDKMILSQYHQYLRIFQKKAAKHFPISCPYDHAIDLKPDFIPHNCKIYPLSPKEQIALNNFLEENLHKGYIQPSKSPMASPFFFIGKKDLDLCTCQDYQALNEGTVKNAYPLLLISKLMDKLKGAKYFTKLDLCSGYNNICIKDRDQWKAAFKTP